MPRSGSPHGTIIALMALQRESAARLDRVLESLTRTQRCATRATLIRELGSHLMERAIDSGALRRVLPGAYAPARIATLHDVRCHAVSEGTRGRVLVGGRSALHLYHADFAAPARVEVVVTPGGHCPTAPWLRARRRPLPDVRGTPRRTASLTREDALVDAWTRGEPRARAGIVYEALWLRIVPPHRVRAAADRLARVPERDRLLALLGDFIEGAQSPGEVLARREVFVAERYRAFERQVKVRVAGRSRVLDMLHRAARVVVEVDGDAYHGGARAVADDRERDAELAAVGFQTVRLSYRDLRDRPEWCRGTVDRVVRGRLQGFRERGRPAAEGAGA